MFSRVDRVNVTVFTYNGSGYDKHILRDCIWSNGVNVNIKTQGVLPIDSIKIQVPLVSNPGYPELWKIKSGDGFNASYVVEGIIDYNFIDGDKRDLERQIRDFESSVDYNRPLAVLDRTKGSPRMRYIEVIC